MTRIKNNKLTIFLLFIWLIWIVSGCGSVNSSDQSGNNSKGTNTSNGDWLIPKDEVVDGGPPPDGIPSIDNPRFKPAAEINYVDSTRLVTAVRVGDTIKAYPHQVMDYHEIVNDKIDQTPYSFTYCPLTGTGIAWKRIIEGATVEYGVSGKLFRNNLIPYDRNTESRYSQMQMRAVHGSRIGTNLRTLWPVVETTWATWEKMYPNSQVLTTDTGYERDYGGYAYGKDYLHGDSGTLFPVKYPDDRLPNKERVLTIIAGDTATTASKAKAYVISGFKGGIQLIDDEIAGKKIIVAASGDLNFAVAFERELNDGTLLNFSVVNDSLPVIMEDQEGNRWDIFGYAVDGPRQGDRLASIKSYIGYWFAVHDFFPNVKIYNLSQSIPR